MCPVGEGTLLAAILVALLKTNRKFHSSKQADLKQTINRLSEVKETHCSRPAVTLLSHFYKSVPTFCGFKQLPGRDRRV